MKYIDNGHYEISVSKAVQLADGSLPPVGRELLVDAKTGGFMWLARKRVLGRLRWTLRDAGGWRLVDGEAVLG